MKDWTLIDFRCFKEKYTALSGAILSDSADENLQFTKKKYKMGLYTVRKN